MSSEAITRNDLKDIINGMLPIFYPVGSYYETSDATFNPNTEWGGTWELELAGQVHVSSGTGYSINGALTNNSDGGNKDAIVPYHNHSVNQFSTGGEGSHTHSLSSHTHAPGGTAADNNDRFVTTSSDGNGVQRKSGSISGSGYFIMYNQAHACPRRAATGGPSNNTSGAGTSHSHTVGAHNTNYTPSSDNRTNANMQPYIVVNRWHRTA